MLTRSALGAFLDERWPCSLDDVRRGTRLGMGPCQGAFCTFRAAGLVAERYAADDPGLADVAAAADHQMTEFLAERHRGTRPIAWGRQLQELVIAAGIYHGSLGLGSLTHAAPATPEGGVEADARP
jgi:glycerol-3-phosphate dehydrogenase